LFSFCYNTRTVTTCRVLATDERTARQQRTHPSGGLSPPRVRAGLRRLPPQPTELRRSTAPRCHRHSARSTRQGWRGKSLPCGCDSRPGFARVGGPAGIPNLTLHHRCLQRFHVSDNDGREDLISSGSGDCDGMGIPRGAHSPWAMQLADDPRTRGQGREFFALCSTL
jgi:hypothetical protein